MKAGELRQQSVEGLKKHILELLREQFNLRMQRGSGQLARASRMREVRREIARTKTILTELSVGAGR